MACVFAENLLSLQIKRATVLYALIFIHRQNRRKRDRTNRVKFCLRRSVTIIDLYQIAIISDLCE